MYGERIRQLWWLLPMRARKRLAAWAGYAALRGKQTTRAVRARMKRTAMPAPHTIHAHRFVSASLQREMPYTLLMPADFDPAARYPVLYLLHGAFSNHTEWATRTRLAEHAARFPIIIVCPEGENACYVTGANGEEWETYIVHDLTQHIETTYHTRVGRGGRAIAGLSMGGFGAFNLGMRHPDRYAAISTHSGAFMLYTRPPRADDDPQFAAVLGPLNGPVREEYNPQQVIAQPARAHGHALPMLAMDCGQEDFPNLLASNRALHRTLMRLGIPHVYRELPGGHTWEYWDREVPFTLQFAAAAMGVSPV